MYCNEFDPFAAAWLRELVAAGHLHPASVDERSITDVAADDVRRHRECHWFAGIGGWPLALRLAGWPAERPVWTGSCPCQPYSSAGKRKGDADERDLWPVFARLIRECRPATVFGEQVASAIRFGWIDRVRADLEAEGYAVGFAVLGAHSVGAPHLRQRLYWVADCEIGRREQIGAACGGRSEGSGAEGRERLGDGGGARGVGDTDDEREGSTEPHGTGIGNAGGASGLAVWDHWRDAIGIDYRDAKRRRVPAEPGLFPLAHGVSGRVAVLRSGECAATLVREASGKEETRLVSRAGALRGAGNAICVQTAALFVRAFLESEGGE